MRIEVPSILLVKTDRRILALWERQILRWGEWKWYRNYERDTTFVEFYPREGCEKQMNFAAIPLMKALMAYWGRRCV